MFKVSTYITSEELLQTWDLDLWQWCCTAKLWGVPDGTKRKFLHNVAFDWHIILEIYRVMWNILAIRIRYVNVFQQFTKELILLYLTSAEIIIVLNRVVLYASQPNRTAIMA